MTEDIENRLAKHNAGQVPHTSKLAAAVALVSVAGLCAAEKPSFSETTRIREMECHLCEFVDFKHEAARRRGTFKVAIYRKTKDGMGLHTNVNYDPGYSDAGRRPTYGLTFHKWADLDARTRGESPAYWLVDAMPIGKFEAVVKPDPNDFSSWE